MTDIRIEICSQRATLQLYREHETKTDLHNIANKYSRFRYNKLSKQNLYPSTVQQLSGVIRGLEEVSNRTWSLPINKQ